MKRRAWIGAALGLVTILGLIAWLVLRDDEPARREWAEAAIHQIKQQTADTERLTAEVERLRQATSTTRPAYAAWVGDQVLIMANGDWIACRSICIKEKQRIPDLFIGLGSDGRWYYSTFHFCIGKVNLLGQRQPKDLAAFADAYWLRPFDGQAKLALDVTWKPGAPWGDEMMPAGTTAQP
jgi:hypothetical protein